MPATVGPVDHVGMQARLQPGGTAIVDLARDARWTYAALDRAVAQAARVLRETHGCEPGDRVASLARNRAELVITHLACARLGLIYVPLNWRLSPFELKGQLDDTTPHLLIGDSFLDTVDYSSVVNIDEFSAAIATASPLPLDHIDRDRPSLILFTSGATGRPKGVVLSEANLDQTAYNTSLLTRATARSVFLVDSPMFHILGIVTNIRAPLAVGGAILVSEGFDATRTLARLADPELAVTHYFGVPQMAAMMRATSGFDPANLKRLTALFTGGAPHPAAAIRAWIAEGISVADGFGMSETGTVFGMPIDLAMIDAKAGSAGIATPGVESRIVDADEIDCAPGARGELLLRGPNISKGYWNRPEETAKAFTDDGWFRTGDIAWRDEDGFHYIVDRKKDMFISGGENVYPAEVEAALADFPGLAEYAVVGVSDAQWGEVGLCALVALPGATIETAAVRAHLELKIARYKLPKHYEIIAALPRTGSGKVQKADLRALLPRV